MQEAYLILFQGISEDYEWNNIEDVVILKGVCMSHTPNLQKHFTFKKTLYFNFIVKFVIIDEFGSRMIVINYAEYFID